MWRRNTRRTYFLLSVLWSQMGEQTIMNILLLADYPFHQSGLSVLGESCYTGLKALGHNITPHSLFDAEGINNLCQNNKYDVVLGVGYWADSERQISIPKRYNQKVALWWVSEAQVAKYRDIVPQADLLLTTSDYCTEVFKRDCPDSNPKTLYIGTNCDFYKPDNSVKPSKTFATFVSSGEVKGAEESLTSVKFLSPKNLDFTYIVHNPFTEYKLEKDYMLRLKNIIEKHNLKKWTRLVCGTKIPLEKMPDIYRSLYAYLAPLRMAGFGIPLIEAGACGVPSIAGDWKPMNEIIQDGYSGVLVPHMAKAIFPKWQEGVWYTEEYRMIDTEILANKIEDLLANPEKRNKMGENMRRVVEEKFNVKTQIKKLEEELFKL